MGPCPTCPPPPTDLTCDHCGGPIVFDHPSDYDRERRGGHRGKFCTNECFLAHVKRGAVVACPVCGRERYRPASHLRRKCCDECYAWYRWHVTRAGLRPLIESWKSSEGLAWRGRARQVWLGRLGGSEPPREGAQRRGRPQTAGLTPEQKGRIRLAARRWGRRRIANEFGLSEWAVRQVLDERPD